MSRGEIDEMMKDIYGDSYQSNRKVHGIIANLDADKVIGCI